VNTSYSYDSVSHLLSVLHQAGVNTLDGASYTYDAAGNRTVKTNYLNSTTSNYTYDPLYELTQVTEGSSTTESYSYDFVGNRLSSSGVPNYSYNSSNELTSTSNGSYTYDANGNTLSDPSGKQYTWDFENRLMQAVVPGTNGGTTTFKYDPFGRRIYKQSPNATSVFVYDGNNLLESVNGAGSEVASYTQGQLIDEPLAELRGSTTDYYAADGLGSITSLSSSTGALANTYTYDSFGNTTASTGTVRNYFQYTAREFDSETNLYFYRARYFDPNSGRFLSEDPMRFTMGANFFPYVHNDPMNRIDPFGLCDNAPNKRKCFAQLKYRIVDDPRAKAIGATHSFWYVQGSSGQQYIISGGPWPPNGSNQSLDVWENENINSGVDNVSATTWWDSGLSGDNCDGVDDMIDEAMGWPDNTIPYSWSGPNSNSVAHELGSTGGFNPPSPPVSFGWGTSPF